jgi:hypothetical protein
VNFTSIQIVDNPDSVFEHASVWCLVLLSYRGITTMLWLCVRITVVAFFILTIDMEGMGCPKEDMMGETSSYSINNVRIAEGIAHSRGTFHQFVSAFERHGPRQTDFMVVVLANGEQGEVPVGIRVTKIEGTTVVGTRVVNTLNWNPTDSTMTCSSDDIVDWRYVDTFEMIGGTTYKAIFELIPQQTKYRIRDALPFLILRSSEISQSTLRVFRDIANGRCETLRRMSDDELNSLKAEMPIRTFGVGRCVVLAPVTVQTYAAYYGGEDAVDLLHERHILTETPDIQSPLIDSSYSGNVVVLRRLIELGFNIDAKDMTGDTALLQATTWNHGDVLDLLLASGANPNARDTRKKTPLFRVVSSRVATSLVSAGADVNALDDNGDSCLAVQMAEGRKEVVRVLVESGAILKYGTMGGVATEKRLNGKAELNKWLDGVPSNTEHPRARINQAVDYGSVLPVKILQSGN